MKKKRKTLEEMKQEKTLIEKEIEKNIKSR